MRQERLTARAGPGGRAAGGHPRSRVRAGAVAAALALSLGLLTGACGDGGVGKAAVAKRLGADPAMRDWTPKQRDCLATLMVDRVGRRELKEYVEGRKRLADVNGDSSGLEADMAKCVRG